MTEQWRDDLATRQGQPDADDDSGLTVSDRPASDCQIFDLSWLGLIAVRGADAATFLQGQLTNDMAQVTATRTQLSGYCNQKGRLLASFRVMRIGEVIYLQTPAERLPELLQRLRIFILRSKVTLEDASHALMRIGIAGDQTESLLAEQGLSLPAQDYDLSRHGDLSVIRLAGAIPRAEILGTGSAIHPLWGRLASQTMPASADDWRRIDIQAGIPAIYNQTADAFIPQMVNLQRLDGLSFSKGCYTGQEVIARMQHLGTIKRRMYLTELTSSSPPQPGDELYAPSSVSQQPTGRVVDVVPLGNDRYLLLAVVEISAVAGGAVRLGEQGPELQFTEPPYGFPADL